MQNEFERKEHCITMKNREVLDLTGVRDVPSFDENEVIAKCDFGEVIIKGERLKIDILDVESGRLSVKGKIVAVYYNERQQMKGFFKRAMGN